MHDNRRSTYRYRQAQTQPPRRRGALLKVLVILAAIGALGFGGRAAWQQVSKAAPAKVATKGAAAPSQSLSGSSAQTVTSQTPAVNHCADNASGKLILVSISARHLWACNGTAAAYDSAVITGMENLAADLTPTGTYQIMGKQTNTHLIGSDSTGHWDDFVNYWMPFLHNQYGDYGFHDATWRANSAFGNVSPDSSDASHGCVETPLATAKWLYNWAVVGTTVTVES